ncbi:MAG: glycosyltransferase [Planctomycetota bacterium]
MSALVSFVLAAYEERDSLPILVGEIRAAAERGGLSYEVVVVDDGSRDGSADWLLEQAESQPDLVPVILPTNRGQSAAMAVGLAAAAGDRLVTMDSDLQNDPADCLALLEALDAENADLATGVRVNRQDSWGKRIGSRIGNAVRRWQLKDQFQDVGCQIRAWKRPVAEAIPKFKGFHRFIPVLARDLGFKVVERDVNHRARQHGTSKYGNLGRAVAGLRDVRGVRWLQSRAIDTRGAVVHRQTSESDG